MNLKEAFQLQNKINGLIRSINSYLFYTENIMTVTETHLRSKALAGQQDETITLGKESKEIYDANKLLLAWKKLSEERSRLISAISGVKRQMEFDFDAEVDENKNRRAFIGVLRDMARLKNTHTLHKNKGVDYIFNNEKNQTPYYYDIEKVQTVDYDKNQVRAMLKALQKEADEVSVKIDEVLLNTEVNYESLMELSGDNDLILEELAGSDETARSIVWERREPAKTNEANTKFANPYDDF